MFSEIILSYGLTLIFCFWQSIDFQFDCEHRTANYNYRVIESKGIIVSQMEISGVCDSMGAASSVYREFCDAI